MSWASLMGRGVDIKASDVESRRFGLQVGRLTVGWQAHEPSASRTLVELLAESRFDLVVARWPAHMLDLPAAVASVPGRLIPADVLLYWEVDPQRLLALGGDRAGRSLSVVEGNANLQGAVEEVVRDAFAEYRNHYAANPALDPQDALAGYVEWARNILLEEPRSVLVLRHSAIPIGVAVLSASHGDLEVELAGLTTLAQGSGLYAHLLRACAQTAMDRGLQRLVISTQAHNVRAQRAWTRLGLEPFAAFTTVHLIR